MPLNMRASGFGVQADRLMHSTLTRGLLRVVAGAALVAGLYVMSLQSYLLFHTTVELFSICVAAAMFMIAWNTRYAHQNGYLEFLGVAYLFIAGIDLVHTLAYKGVGILPVAGGSISTQLWIQARYLQALTLVVAPTFLHRRIRSLSEWTFAVYAAAVSLLLLSVFAWRVFPTTFVEGAGVTLFKRASEYAISFVFFVALLRLVRDRRMFESRVAKWLAGSIVLSIGAELLLSSYVDLYGLSNQIGHLFKLAAFYLIYRAIIDTGLRDPYAIILRDLKRNEAALEQLNQGLLAENAARQQAEASVRARNEELKSFAYTVSHDLKAPLRGIAGYSAELDRKHRAGLDERGQFCIGQILTATRNLDRLIEDLLRYSRLDAETPSLTEVNLRHLVEGILQAHSLIIAEQRVEVTVDVPPITLETWERGLAQVLANLIDNALKYSRKATPPRLTIAAEELPGTCRVTVADNGIGFDMKYHDRIFGLFNRLVRADEYEGTGAGLAIVKKLTEKLGGTIRAESALGQGATFFVELPNQPRRRTAP
jgi:signal transduction histidine kinase